MSVVIRPVASTEAGFVGPPPTTCAAEATMAGRLDLDALSAAFDALRRRHPALDAAVRPGEAGYVFASSGDQRAPFTVEPVAKLPFHSTPHVDPSRALAGLWVATTGTRHRVTLALSHALSDGIHGYALYTELWSVYREIVRTGRIAERPPLPFPESSEQFVADHGIPVESDAGRDRLDGIRWYGAFPAGRPTQPCLPEVTSLRFPPEVTARFAAACAGPGMHAMLSGILLAAERAGFVDEPTDRPIRIGAMTLVDLRRRLGVPEPTGVTNFVGASFAAVEVTSAAGGGPAAVDAVVAAGSEVARHVRADLASGRCVAAMVPSAEPADAGAAHSGPREPAVTLSNLGPLHVELPAELTLEDLRPRITMDSAPLHIPPGPDVASPRLPAPIGTIYQAFTFSDRLGIEAITLGGTTTPAARSAVAERITLLVHEVADYQPRSLA